jgi:hypothetical protein
LFQFSKTDCGTYRGIPVPSTSYKMLSNILLLRLCPYIDEIIGDHRCGFRHNRSATGEEMGSTMRVHQLFIDFKKAYDSFMREMLYCTVFYRV